ncbi:hypothetical protein K402DRAFT_52679 [Aulographum hederae CBS 113979]|uniref:Zn(2)-C6 fungal-type domain-containing protein n=1 Tax=Aulographum hederae CBS 113979 TaxID=1176131 RepID=A0A6G1H1U7_9PEZI|nr:hypothetical protein K402DRAFT_52679 [Aulographum hederae CBS 113979]
MDRLVQAGSGNEGIPPTNRPRRPCDACRKRKSRCELNDGDSTCVLCRFHRQACTFNENPLPRKRRKAGTPEEPEDSSLWQHRDSESSQYSGSKARPPSRPSQGERKSSHASIRQHAVIEDYAKLKGPSLLKKTLGLQNHRHSRYVGQSSLFDHQFLRLDAFDDKNEAAAGPATIRKISDDDTFLLIPDEGTQNHEDEIKDLDAIELLVAPHGQALIHLYFRIVHPSYPVLHKHVYLEKYRRTHREFSPPLLAAVYILALNWWEYSSELALLAKPDLPRLEKLALKSMSDVIHRPKLSTIQAGLLLLQRPEGDSWALTTQLVGLGQDLGLHLDCSRWRIPSWEKGLRKRLAWALFMQDKWGSLVHGRPSHIFPVEWKVKEVTENDFPEKAADEDDEEGSTEVENGRVLFCEMIALSQILTLILSEFHTLQAAEEVRIHSKEGARWVLDKAKPIQLRLKEWFARLPESLKMENVKMMKLSSTGYLHLAYYATEITLHRSIVRSLLYEQNSSLIGICRSAAHARLTSAMDFVKSLRPEHLQSFWYSASKYNFALIGTFVSLLWATAPTKEEADICRKKLDEYRWTLRLSSKSADFLDRAIAMLTASTLQFVKAIPEKPTQEDLAQGVLPQTIGETEMASLADDEESYLEEQTPGGDLASPLQEEIMPDYEWFDFASPEGGFQIEAMGTEGFASIGQFEGMEGEL